LEAAVSISGNALQRWISKPGEQSEKLRNLCSRLQIFLMATGQQDALNPAIVVHRICDQLTNVCEAAADAKAACLTAKAAVNPSNKNQATADTFNAALGFQGWEEEVRWEEGISLGWLSF
jgi:hypothetical protein